MILNLLQTTIDQFCKGLQISAQPTMEYLGNSSQNSSQPPNDGKTDDHLNPSQPVIECASVDVTATQTVDVTATQPVDVTAMQTNNVSLDLSKYLYHDFHSLLNNIITKLYSFW